MLGVRIIILAYPKNRTRDPGILVGPKIPDPGPILWMRPGTRDPKGGTRDTRPGTRLISGTRDPKGGTQDPRPEALVLHGT